MAEREGGLKQENDEIEQFRTWMRGEGADPYADFDEEDETPDTKEEEKEPPPSVERRKQRQITVTFGNQVMVERLRRMCDEWDLTVPHRSDPAISELVEYLITPRLEAAEDGKLEPPSKAWRAERYGF
jgi:hypothetical protein